MHNSKILQNNLCESKAKETTLPEWTKSYLDQVLNF